MQVTQDRSALQSAVDQLQAKVVELEQRAAQVARLAETTRRADQEAAASKLAGSEACSAALNEENAKLRATAHEAAVAATAREAALGALRRPFRRVFTAAFLHQGSINLQKSYFGIPGPFSNMVGLLQDFFYEHDLEELHSAEANDEKLTEFEQCLTAKWYLHTAKPFAEMAGEVCEALSVA